MQQISRKEAERLDELMSARLAATHVSMYPERYSKSAADAIYARAERMERVS